MRYMLIIVIAIATIEGFAAQDSDGSPNAFGADCNLVISGTARGGVITLIFPGRPFKLKELEVNTVAGEDANKVAKRIYDSYTSKTTITSATIHENKLTVGSPSVFNGEVGMRSTDPGIFSLPRVANLKAEITANKDIKLLWSLPKNVTFDTIYITGSTDWELKNNETSHTVIIPADDPVRTSIKVYRFRIVGVKNGTPSDVATLEVPNPKYVPSDE